MDKEEILAAMESLEHIGETVSGFLKTMAKAGLSRGAAESLLLKQMGVEVVFHGEGGND